MDFVNQASRSDPDLEPDLVVKVSGPYLAKRSTSDHNWSRPGSDPQYLSQVSFCQLGYWAPFKSIYD
jgi:hypothetical protein